MTPNGSLNTLLFSLLGAKMSQEYKIAVNLNPY